MLVHSLVLCSSSKSPHRHYLHSLWSLYAIPIFCRPTRAFNPSTSYCNCIYHAAHFLAPHGLGHSFHIPYNVDNWSDLYPVFWASCCCFFLAAICCGMLVGTNLVMLMACGYGAAVEASSCPSCDLLCDIAFLLNFRCRLPPLRFLCCARWMHNPMAVAGPIAATAQSP